MAKINPDHLLEQAARLLERRSGASLIRQADRRRAISSAYYAVFHLATGALADELVGTTSAARKSPRYALVCRSVDHNRLRKLCEQVAAGTPDGNLVACFPSGGIGADLQKFSTEVKQLQEKRNQADYDPSHWIRIEDAQTAIASARTAIESFRNATAARRKAFLILLAFKSR